MPRQSRPTTRAISRTSLPWLTGLLLAVATGLVISLQGGINGTLGLDDGIAAAVVSFTTGLVVIAATGLALPKGLVTGLGMITGQLLGSLALDLAFPAPGTLVALPTILGTLLTLSAIIVATLPWPKGALASRCYGGGPRRKAGRLGHAASCTAFPSSVSP